MCTCIYVCVHLQPRYQKYPGLHQKKRGQQGEGGDCPPPFCPCKAPPEVLCPGLEHQHKEDSDMLVQRRLDDAQRCGAPLLCGKIEKAGLVQYGEEKAPEDLTTAFQYLKEDGDQLCTWSNTDRTRGNGFKVKEGRFRLDFRKKFFTRRAVRQWHSCPEKLRVSRTWKCSRPGWMGPWAA